MERLVLGLVLGVKGRVAPTVLPHVHVIQKIGHSLLHGLILITPPDQPQQLTTRNAPAATLATEMTKREKCGTHVGVHEVSLMYLHQYLGVCQLGNN